MGACSGLSKDLVGIGANLSTEGGEDEGVDDQAVKVGCWLTLSTPSIFRLVQYLIHLTYVILVVLCASSVC